MLGERLGCNSSDFGLTIYHFVKYAIAKRRNFMADKKILAMSINVKEVKKKWQVLLRGFDST